ncbi:hypothetical protein EVAR_98731_1 [Eumeta japonica]|uniref:Helitron helicase-like domain-containing protein n=1 Tax=Eumeta variegata TaxID=151549 RepID=A0A4C1ZK98_EUMVA|nr:hypothetical protein EVAR_98731_1 [Eumeta japonica]
MNAYLLNIQIFCRGLYNCRGVAAITYAFCAEDPEFEPEKTVKKTYNFNRQDSSQENLEENPANEVSDQNQDLDLRRRASHRVATESNEERKQRLEDQRRRTAKRVATETNEQREQRQNTSDGVHQKVWPVKVTNSSLMELLEYIIRARNGYVQGYRMMRDVEEDINRLSLPKRNKNIVYLKNIDNIDRVEPFTYPLFYPAGTDGYSVDLQLQTPYASRNHLTRLELAQYRLSFRPECIKFSMDATSTGRPDLQEIPFNALHFGGRLFQQYLVDTYIRVERDRIQWIKYNQNKILAEQYTGVTCLINELAKKCHCW